MMHLIVKINTISNMNFDHRNQIKKNDLEDLCVSILRDSFLSRQVCRPADNFWWRQKLSFAFHRNISAKPKIFRIFRLCRNYFVLCNFTFLQLSKYFGHGLNILVMDKILNKTNLIVNINQIMYNFTFLYLSKYFGHERNILAKPEIFRIFRLC